MRISLDERLKIAKLHIYEDVPTSENVTTAAKRQSIKLAKATSK